MKNEYEEDKSESEDFKVVIRDIKDEEFESFQTTLNKELILNLYKIFTIYEQKGLIDYEVYMEAMTATFKKYNKTDNFTYIFDLIFNRFQKIKCILKNNKAVFYLTEMKYKNSIETYIIVCFLTILIKCKIFDKIKLLFKLTDIDNDGFLNKEEIKLMISTVNFLFCFNSTIGINSSILSQSLMYIYVKGKINKLMNQPGNLGIILQKEKCVNFDTFFKCLEKIQNYKYEIIPCFINIRKCLYNQRKEKIIDIKDKIKKEFVTAASDLSIIKPRNPSHLFQKNFTGNFEKLIKTVKRKKREKIDFNSSNNILIKKKKLLLGIKERNKTLKELIKESTILSEEENEEQKNENLNIIKKKMSRNKSNNFQYVFEADFDKIKKIEVEPALLRFADENTFNMKMKKYYSNDTISKHNINKEINPLKTFKHQNTLDFTSKLNNINKRNIKSAKNINKMKVNNLNQNLFKRSTILPLSYKNDKNLIFRNLKQLNEFTLDKRHNNSMKNLKYNKKFNSRNNKSYINSNKINNISSNKSLFNKSLTFFNNKKKASKIKFRNEKNIFLKGSKSYYDIKSKKVPGIKNLKSVISNKVKTNDVRDSYNKFFNKTKTINLNNKNLSLLDNDRTNKYLNCDELLKELDEEKNIADGKYFFDDKKLIIIYDNLMQSKNKIKFEKKRYRESDFSLRFFDLREKLFPDSFGRNVNSFHKIKIRNNKY